MTSGYSDQFDFSEYKQGSVIDFLPSPSPPVEDVLMTPPTELFFAAPFLTFSPKSGVNAFNYPPDLPKRNSETLSPKTSSIRKAISLPPLQSYSVQFFLAFHRETVTEAHYFRWYDYPKLCTKTMLAMAKQSDALRHSIVAFSALIYSCKIRQSAREVAFLYYTMALQELRLLLNKSPMDMEECLTAVATALQLASFDVSLLC